MNKYFALMTSKRCNRKHYDMDFCLSKYKSFQGVSQNILADLCRAKTKPFSFCKQKDLMFVAVFAGCCFL